jgi:hypothetical protein
MSFKAQMAKSFTGWYRSIILAVQVTISILLISVFVENIIDSNNEDRVLRAIISVLGFAISSYVVYGFYKHKTWSYFILIVQYLTFLIFSLMNILRNPQDLRYIVGLLVIVLLLFGLFREVKNAFSSS